MYVHATRLDLCVVMRMYDVRLRSHLTSTLIRPISIRSHQTYSLRLYPAPTTPTTPRQQYRGARD